jgi:hypothetical protein
MAAFQYFQNILLIMWWDKSVTHGGRPYQPITHGGRPYQPITHGSSSALQLTNEVAGMKIAVV